MPVNDHALRGLLPEQMLVRRRDGEALWEKYRNRAAGHRMAHFLRRIWLEPMQPSEHADNIDVFESFKIFGSVAIEIDDPMPAGGRDGDYVIERNDASQIQMHVLTTPEFNFRSDLQTTAQYIAGHEEFFRRDYIVGVTYRELGRLMGVLGFAQMQIKEPLLPGYMADLQASYEVFRALNGIEDKPMEPVFMYLPTNQFIQTFGPNG